MRAFIVLFSVVHYPPRHLLPNQTFCLSPSMIRTIGLAVSVGIRKPRRRTSTGWHVVAHCLSMPTVSLRSVIHHAPV